MSEVVAIKSEPAATTAIFRYLREDLDVGGQTQSGVFLSTIGSLGGFASQQAVWKACIEPGNRNAGDFLASFKTKTGETLYFGEAINLFLQTTRPGFFSFYSFVAGAVPNPGPDTLPDLKEIFAHVSRSVGKPDFWNVRLPEKHGLFPSPRVTLNQRWREVQDMLIRHGNPPAEWPAILGMVAYRTLQGAANIVGASLAARLTIEAAIISSKADPRTVPGATSGLEPPARWSNRALLPKNQASVVEEVYRFIPSKLPV